MTILIIIAIVASVVIYVVYLTHGNYEEPTKQAKQPEVPKHFDLLDENGDPLPPTPRQEPEVKSLHYFCLKDKGYHVTVWPKSQRLGDYLEFTIAGLNYCDNSKYLGEFTGYLEAEPTNDYDPNAIKVLAHDSHHVGYVPQDQTKHVREFLTLPCPCYCYIGKNNGRYFSDCYIIRK